MPHTIATSDHPVLDERSIYAIERPHRSLWTYYIFASLLSGPGMPFVLVYSYFRYHTMRYRFDDEGVSMSWGILFRREVNLTYARIQDIHLTSNLFERWLGLARIQVQTASGSSAAEMTIEGVREFEALRDFLYSKMRGTKHAAVAGAHGVSARVSNADDAALAAVLHEIAGELRDLRQSLEAARERRSDA